MRRDDEVFRPVKQFAYYYFFGVGSLALVQALTTKANNNVRIFIFMLALGHVLIGLSILSRRKFGFILMKYYLYFMRPMYPVLSSISKKMLEYIESNNIKEYFR